MKLTNSQCGYCDYTDGYVYTSLPPQVKCSITGEFHFRDHECDIEVEPVKHGKWIDPAAENCYRCSICEEYTTMEAPKLLYHYCPNCGARMSEGSEK